MSYLLSLSSRLKKNPVTVASVVLAPVAAPTPAPEIQIVESFLSVSESVEVAPPSTSEVDPELAAEIPIVEETVSEIPVVEELPTEESSEEQCA